MTHNLSFHYHADMTTKGLGLQSAKVEVLQTMLQTFVLGIQDCVAQTSINLKCNLNSCPIQINLGVNKAFIDT